MKLICRIIDLFAPDACVVCGSTVSREEFGLCKACFDSISLATGKCDRCSGFLKEGRCTICSDRAFYPEKNIVVAEYEGAMKAILHHYKTLGNRRLGRHLIALAWESVRGTELGCHLATSVPMVPYKKWRRGFNHSELIARGISRRLSIPYRALLREKRGAHTQKGLGSRDRFFNVLGRFEAVRVGDFSGKAVLLIDDVYTTGSTLNECARVLLEAGAAKVVSMSVARAVDMAV